MANSSVRHQPSAYVERRQTDEFATKLILDGQTNLLESQRRCLSVNKLGECCEMKMAGREVLRNGGKTSYLILITHTDNSYRCRCSRQPTKQNKNLVGCRILLLPLAACRLIIITLPLKAFHCPWQVLPATKVQGDTLPPLPLRCHTTSDLFPTIIGRRVGTTNKNRASNIIIYTTTTQDHES